MRTMRPDAQSLSWQVGMADIPSHPTDARACPSPLPRQRPVVSIETGRADSISMCTPSESERRAPPPRLPWTHRPARHRLLVTSQQGHASLYSYGDGYWFCPSSCAMSMPGSRAPHVGRRGKRRIASRSRSRAACSVVLATCTTGHTQPPAHGR